MMVQRLLQLIVVVFLACFSARHVQAAPFEVTNIVVSIEAKDAVQARDQAITKAQRIGFAALLDKTEGEVSQFTDAQIARLVRGFSLQGERVVSRFYRASFTIRFNQISANNFIISNGLSLGQQAARGETVVVTTAAKVVPAAPTDPATAQTGEVPAVEAAPEKVAQPIIVLPVLDIGSRRVIWDEPNPWRDIWQKSDQSMAGLPVRVPMGDVDDVTNIPDTSFLTGGSADIQAMLDRYGASALYAVVAKNQGAAMNPSGGMALSLYRHDGKQLKFIRKMVMRPRPGYLFNDAVSPAMQMIVMSRNNGDTAAAPQEVLESSSRTTSTTIDPTVMGKATPVTGPIVVTVPYQSLPQWLGIQRRLRLVPGVKSLVPVRVSPSSAQLKIVTTTSSFEDLRRNLAIQKFDIQKMPNGEMALIEQ